MFIISRNIGESFQIGKEVFVQIKSVKVGDDGCQVRLGIEAPPDIKIEYKDNKKFYNKARKIIG